MVGLSLHHASATAAASDSKSASQLSNQLTPIKDSGDN